VTSKTWGVHWLLNLSLPLLPKQFTVSLLQLPVPRSLLRQLNILPSGAHLPSNYPASVEDAQSFGFN
jgi:hypothetical protein